jgi:hypothetical protein
MARMLFFEVAFYFDSTGIEDIDSINPNEKALSNFFMAQMPLSNLNRRSIRAINGMENSFPLVNQRISEAFL